MNKTIKTYKTLTVAQVGEMLQQNDWKPLQGLYFRSGLNDRWYTDTLLGINCSNAEDTPFETSDGYLAECASVSVLDPLCVPKGCPPMSPWMAYIGYGAQPRHEGYRRNYLMPSNSTNEDFGWVSANGNSEFHYCVDVRKEWTQLRFPEHCKICAYQAPDACDEFINDYKRRCCTDFFNAADIRDAYALGQANPITKI